MKRQAPGLNTIARAEATPAQAREILQTVFGPPSPELLRDACLALRASAWKAQDERRRDAELREWDALLRAAACLMARLGAVSLASRAAESGASPPWATRAP